MFNKNSMWDLRRDMIERKLAPFDKMRNKLTEDAQRCIRWHYMRYKIKKLRAEQVDLEKRNKKAR